MLTTLLAQPKKLVALDNSVEAPVVEKTYTKDELKLKVYHYANVYGVSAETMISVINCENTEWDTKLQSRIINKAGVREDSWGLSQIHLPSWKNITKEQATDPDFSLDFMARKLSEGKGNLWTCWRKQNP